MPNIYIIKRGDTLSQLAKTQGTTVSELLKLNPSITNPNLIYTGRTLNLPEKQPDYSTVKSIPEANKIINQDQLKDIEKAKIDIEPPVKKSYTDLTEAMKSITGGGITPSKIPSTDLGQIGEAIKPDIIKPVIPKFEEKYKEYRTTYGIETLETEINDLQAQESDIQATIRTRRTAEQAKPVAMNVIAGKVSEVERQEAERLDSIQRQINYKTNQLNTKYKVVETYMKLADTDYDNATQAYDKQLSSNISMFNTLKGIDESQKNEQEKIIDNARASAQIIYNQLTSGGAKIDNLTGDQQNLITKLELQAGLPAGFYKTLQNKNPKAEIISTINWTDANNNKYASIISRDSSTGSLSTKNILLGKEKAPEGKEVKATPEETKIYYKQTMTTQLQKVVGKDGYISPANWAKARRLWSTNTAYGAEDFDDAFSGYINPKHPQDYTGFENYKPGFIKKSTTELEGEGIE